MGTRSPLLGYNHDVKYRDRLFNVQTEDSGPGNPHLFTHLYFRGTVLATKRQDYDPESTTDLVRGLMQGQHKALLKELKIGVYDDHLMDFFAARRESLDSPAGLAPLEPPPDASPAPTGSAEAVFPDPQPDLARQADSASPQAAPPSTVGGELGDIEPTPTPPQSAPQPPGLELADGLPALELDSPAQFAPPLGLEIETAAAPPDVLSDLELPALDLASLGILAGPEPDEPSAPRPGTHRRPLDLDALPDILLPPQPDLEGLPLVETQLPLPVPVPRADAHGPGGPGVYARRGVIIEKPFGTPTPEPVAPARGTMPGTAMNAPPVARTAPPSARTASPPVVVVPAARRPHERPSTPVAPQNQVVVQRTVSVGTGGGSPQPFVPRPPRRPAQAIPYVVQEGSHPVVGPANQARATATYPQGAAPPRSTAARSTVNPSNRAPADLIADKSLDEVILEYLESDPSSPGRR